MLDEHRKKWAAAGIAVLLLIITAMTVHNAGWTQGFAMGLIAGNGDSAQVLPYLAYRGHGFGMGGFFGFFGLIFHFGFFLFFLALIAKFFGFGRWKRHGHHGPFWGHHEQHEARRHGYGRDEYPGHVSNQNASVSRSTPPQQQGEAEGQNRSWTNI